MNAIDWTEISFGPINLYNVPKLGDKNANLDNLTNESIECLEHLEEETKPKNTVGCCENTIT